MVSNIALLTNAEGKTVGQKLKELIEKHDEVMMAVAYIKSSGYDRKRS